MSLPQAFPTGKQALYIMVADDCQITQRTLVLFLKGQGHKVDIANNGQECLTAVLRNSYDLVISDIDMPEMSGIECATHIREAGLTLPIIAMTATAPEIIRQKCFAAGMSAFMPKPLNFPMLKRHLAEISQEKFKTHPVG